MSETKYPWDGMGEDDIGVGQGTSGMWYVVQVGGAGKSLLCSEDKPTADLMAEAIKQQIRRAELSAAIKEIERAFNKYVAPAARGGK